MKAFVLKLVTVLDGLVWLCAYALMGIGVGRLLISNDWQKAAIEFTLGLALRHERALFPWKKIVKDANETL